MGIWQNPGTGEFDRVRLSRHIKDSDKSLPDFHGNLLRQMVYLLTKWTLIPQVECGKMSPVTCTGLYSTSDKGTTLTDTFSFPGDKVLLLILKITKILSGRRENQKQFYLS